MRVLVVGGSGYLGQFVLKAFSDAYPDTEWVGYTYKSTKLPIPPEDDVHAYEVDLATGEGADACIADATKGGESLDLIVNCAAAQFTIRSSDSPPFVASAMHASAPSPVARSTSYAWTSSSGGMGSFVDLYVYPTHSVSG